MKKTRVFLLLFIGAILTISIGFKFLFSSPLSSDQSDTRDLLGPPDQFVITYLPQGGDDGTSMARNEAWYYYDSGKQITFLGGEIISVDPYIPEKSEEATKLLPEQFDVGMDLEDVKEELGTEAITQASDMPVFDNENLQTYLSKDALFIIENGYLTYFQTLSNDGTEDAQVYLSPSPAATSGDTTVNTINNVYSFSIQLPKIWILQEHNIVLSNYDTSSVFDEADLPEERLKCDFTDSFSATEEDAKENSFSGENNTVLTRYLINSEDEEGPGYGDGIAYQIQAADRSDLWLVCFALHESLVKDLEEALKTIKYVTE